MATALSIACLPARAELRPYWNVQWGSPQGPAAGLGLFHGRISGDGLQIAKRAMLLELRPGLDGGALHIGFAPVAFSTRGFAFGGAAVKGTLLRTWRMPSSSFAPGQTYAGAELHFAWIVKGSVGMLWRVSGDAGKSRVLTWGVGLGL
jgi:hypothetical protein